MSQKSVYVLHKNGAPNHYKALDYFLNKKGKLLKYREFSVLGSIYKSIIKLDAKLFYKQVINLIFLVQLFFSKEKRIVLGIAPFDKKLVRLLPILKNHKVFYHTSWTCWDGKFQPKSHYNNETVLKAWRNFLENITDHIFAVSPIAKSQLLENYEISPDSISEVYHTLRDDFLNSNGHEPSIDCIFIGRLVPQKGLQELLDFFSDKSDKTLTIIGEGKLENLVETYANTYDNITFRGQISNGDELKTILQKHRYLVLNSIKTEKWEELFGIVIIESMSQGVV
ncbi:MAG: glycosyltransferase, partial [Flavobacteriaceae bacterium]|nr:glycosyltransferase [Flavobacteriaceae bacterium]